MTAHKGASPLVGNKTYLDAAAGLLAVEAGSAWIIRSTLLGMGMYSPAVIISNVRDAVDGRSDDNRPILLNGVANRVPTDVTGFAFGCTTAQVLTIAYQTSSGCGGRSLWFRKPGRFLVPTPSNPVKGLHQGYIGDAWAAVPDQTIRGIEESLQACTMCRCHRRYSGFSKSNRAPAFHSSGRLP
ncbi:hypothetical protein ACFY5D_03815 [Paeniglutamicibacter sp. NPDC012692]|uniref:hypothetical protein n=1 Tax=Paeniglutamicibacter sp. NPDC012692 TaxID=3364388 RepID=UPI0036B9B88E